MPLLKTISKLLTAGLIAFSFSPAYASKDFNKPSVQNYVGNKNFWSGCYIGGGAGAQFINNDVEGMVSLSQQGYVGELSLGCRAETNSNWVIGAFVYGGISNVDGEVLGFDFGQDSYYGGGIELGYTIGRILPHVIVAYEKTYDSGDLPLGDLDNWRVGAGIDLKILNNTSLGIQATAGFADSEVGGIEIDTNDIKVLGTVKFQFYK